MPYAIISVQRLFYRCQSSWRPVDVLMPICMCTLSFLHTSDDDDDDDSIHTRALRYCVYAAFARVGHKRNAGSAGVWRRACAASLDDMRTDISAVCLPLFIPIPPEEILPQVCRVSALFCLSSTDFLSRRSSVAILSFFYRNSATRLTFRPFFFLFFFRGPRGRKREKNVRPIPKTEHLQCLLRPTERTTTKSRKGNGWGMRRPAFFRGCLSTNELFSTFFLFLSRE